MAKRNPVGVMNGNFRGGDYFRYARQVEAAARMEALTNALREKERELMEKCYALEGDAFVEWYDSDAVPAFGSTAARCRMIEQRIADIKLRNANTATEKSNALSNWMRLNWDRIPEIPL